MGKIADLIGVQKTVIDIYKESAMLPASYRF